MIDKSKVIIRPETPSEYEKVNDIIYKAFSEQHGNGIGNYIMEHFINERQKETFIPELSLVAVLLSEKLPFMKRTSLPKMVKIHN